MGTIVNDEFSGNSATATTLLSVTGIPLFFTTIGLSNDGNLLSSNVAGSGNQNFPFVIPVGFSNLLSAHLVCTTSTAGATGAGKSITLASSFALFNALKTTNQQTNSFNITIPALNTNFTIDVSSVLVGVVANTVGGIKITHNAIGGSVRYTGLLIIYN